MGQREEGVHIEKAFYGGGGCLKEGGPPAGLRGGNKPQVTLGNGEVVQARKPAQDGQARGALDGPCDPTTVRVTPHPIDDDPGQGNVGVEDLVAARDRGRAAGHGPRVDDEHHGGTEQLSHLRAASRVVVVGEAVEQAHDALDDGDVRVASRASKKCGHTLPRDHPCIQGARRTPRGEGVIRGIDVVGPHFERLNGQAATPQRGNDAGGDGRLAHTAVCSCDEKARDREGDVSRPGEGFRYRVTRVCHLISPVV